MTWPLLEGHTVSTKSYFASYPETASTIEAWDGTSEAEAPADHVFGGIYMGGNTSTSPADMPAVNCCWTAHHPGENNSPFGDTYISDVMRKASDAFLSAITYRTLGTDLLVRCQMGWNRSGLIVAGLLIAENQLEPEDAIAAVRTARGSNALNNKSFVRFLMDGGFPPMPGERVRYHGSVESRHGLAVITGVDGKNKSLTLLSISCPTGSYTPVELIQVNYSSVSRGIGVHS